jgi:hypothetical protein
MKAGKIILWVAGIGVIATAAAYIWYRPKASIVWDSKTNTGTATLAGKTSTWTATTGQPAVSSWNGYSLGINANNNGLPATYFLKQHSTTIESGQLLPGNGGSSNVSISVT